MAVTEEAPLLQEQEFSMDLQTAGLSNPWAPAPPPNFAGF